MTARSRGTVFTVRLWKEESAGGAEYRGTARDLVDGAFCNFRTWSDLADFMVARLEEGRREDARRPERSWR